MFLFILLLQPSNEKVNFSNIINKINKKSEIIIKIINYFGIIFKTFYDYNQLYKYLNGLSIYFNEKILKN